MRILVTGGAGYVGSHVVYFLKNEGHDLVIYDNLSTGHADVAEILQVPLKEGDIGDEIRLRRIFDTQKVDAVMHFAGSIMVEESCRMPSEYYRNNFSRVLVLLDLMIEFKIKFFLFSSTAAIFGQAEGSVTLSEDALKNPINPYGRSKLMLEQILPDYEYAYGLKSTILRYFNAVGNHEEGLIGQSYPHLTHLIPSALNVAMGKSEELLIFGNDYPTFDGTCIRDFIHVCDLARAHLLALQYMIQSGKSTDYNLGSGQGFSVMQVIDMVEKITDRKIPVRVVPRRPGDPAVLVANSTKCLQMLEWVPEYDLYRIIKSAWMWEQNRRY